VAAVALDAPPRFKLKDLTPPSPASPPTYTPLSHRYKTKFSNLTGLPSLAEATISTYHSLCTLTTFKDTICLSPDTFPDNPSFEISAHIIESIERHCLSIIQSPLVNYSSPSPVHSIYPLFGNAALIHIMVFMRESPRRLPFAHILSNRIRDCLERVDTRVFQLQYPELLMWVCIMGGLGGVGTENQIWFAGLLAKAASGASIAGLGDVEMVVREWLWTRLYVDELSEGFWADFDVAQGMEEVGEVEDGDAKEMETNDGPFGYRFSV
jgi:hypothetical protein